MSKPKPISEVIYSGFGEQLPDAIKRCKRILSGNIKKIKLIHNGDTIIVEKPVDDEES